MKRISVILACLVLLTCSVVRAELMYALSTSDTITKYDTAVVPGVSSPFASGIAGNCLVIAADAAGNVYAVANYSGDITKYTSTGVGSTFASGLGGVPIGITVAPTGDIFVTRWDAGDVLKLDSGGGYSVYGTGLDQPMGVAMGPDGMLYVGERTQISKINSSGVRTAVVAAESPYGLAFDGSDNLYYTSYNTASVRRYEIGTATDTLVASVSGPAGLALSSTGDFYVACVNANKIVKVTPGGVVSDYASVTQPLGVAFVPVPLPTTAAMGLLGAGLTLIRRRRTAKAS